MVVVRAVYRDGKFQPLDTVELQEGQEVQLHIVDQPVPIQNLIGDMLAHFEHDETDFDEEAVMRALDQALVGQRPLSEIIIEERPT